MIRSMHHRGKFDGPEPLCSNMVGRSSSSVRIVTPKTRAALAVLLTSDPHRFIAACAIARVTSLREVPAYLDLLKTDPWQARQVALLAEEAGIKHLK